MRDPVITWEEGDPDGALVIDHLNDEVGEDEEPVYAKGRTDDGRVALALGGGVILLCVVPH